MVDCRNPVTVVGSPAFSPASAIPGVEGYTQLVDNQVYTVGRDGNTLGYGARTTATSTSPYITLQLDAVYSTVAAVSVWPLTEFQGSIALGQNLTIWLHATANFATDPAPVMCEQGINTFTRWETYTQCPKTSGIRYVTIQRFTATPDALGLQEVRIYSSGMYYWCRTGL